MRAVRDSGPGRRGLVPARTLAVLGCWLATCCWLGAGTAAAAPVPAAAGGERITSYDIRFTLRGDASMHVTEKIIFDFAGDSGKHGIERFLPLKTGYDSERNRVYPLSNATAGSPTGAPSRLETIGGDVTTLRVGDPDRTVSGVQVYVLDYDLAGVVNTVGAGQELYWNAIGNQWQVPVVAATVTVTGPVAVQRTACFEGGQGSTTPCTQSQAAGAATYTSSAQLQPGEGLTVVAGFPAGTFPGAAPILRERWTVAKAFALTPASGAGALGLLGLLAGGTAVLAGRAGRDRRYLGVVPGLTPGPGEQQRTARVGVRGREPIAVQFTPPRELRVGELGTLIDERANVVDVTATIIDLAVRGYLRIEEVAPDDGDGKAGDRKAGDRDWRLVRTGKDTADLRDYEENLFDAIFDDRSQVVLSDLRTTFSSSLAMTQRLLYAEVTERGWFRANPRTVRIRWWVIGGIVLVLGLVATVLLAVFTHWALVGVAALLSGVIMIVLAGRMPARTAGGTALLAQARGFRLYLEKAEAEQIRFEEGRDVFSRYLPYAIVFGVAERWAGVFAQLAASGAAVAAPTWYVGGYYGAGPFDYLRFGGVMTSFSAQTSSTIQAAAPSSSGSSGFSGGFSGGGGGGGGGGSW